MVFQGSCDLCPDHLLIYALFLQLFLHKACFKHSSLGFCCFFPSFSTNTANISKPLNLLFLLPDMTSPPRLLAQLWKMLRAQGAREKKWQILLMNTQHQGCDVLEQRRRAFHRKGTQGVKCSQKPQGEHILLVVWKQNMGSDDKIVIQEGKKKMWYELLRSSLWGSPGVRVGILVQGSLWKYLSSWTERDVTGCFNTLDFQINSLRWCHIIWTCCQDYVMSLATQLLTTWNTADVTEKTEGLIGFSN